MTDRVGMIGRTVRTPDGSGMVVDMPRGSDQTWLVRFRDGSEKSYPDVTIFHTHDEDRPCEREHCPRYEECGKCHDAAATLRVLHDGGLAESRSCADCWTLYQEYLAKWTDAGRELVCDLCQQDVDGSHLRAEPLNTVVDR
jgi:hypothetical protein